MTVEKLIEKLQTYDASLPVVLYIDEVEEAGRCVNVRFMVNGEHRPYVKSDWPMEEELPQVIIVGCL